MNMRIFQELSSKHQFGLYTKELTHQVAQKNTIYSNSNIKDLKERECNYYRFSENPAEYFLIMSFKL